MEILKKTLKALALSVIIFIITLVAALLVNVIAEFSPTLLVILLVVMLWNCGCIFNKD